MCIEKGIRISTDTLLSIFLSRHFAFHWHAGLPPRRYAPLGSPHALAFAEPSFLFFQFNKKWQISTVP